jgi:hypothetical protein
MKTDDLIKALAKDIDPVRSQGRRLRLALAIAAGAGLGLFMLIAFFAVRPDIGVSLPAVLAKAGFAAAFSATGLMLALRLARPGQPTRTGLVLLLVLAAISLAAAAIAVAGADPGERVKAWLGGGFPWCVVAIPVLAAPTASLMVWLVRDLAPTRVGLTGAAIGAFAGGIGAMIYAMYCPIDQVAFVTTWYVVGIALSAAVCSVLAARFLRW